MITNKLLFYGPKGCGKSQFASATFGEFAKLLPGWITVEVQKAQILESPIDNLKRVFEMINQYQVNGILIEDFDALLADLAASPAAKRFLLESIKKTSADQFLIATTRHPTKIEETIIADFDNVVPFYYLSECGRRDILRVHTEVIRKVALSADINLDYIAKRTAWFSGAELENVIINAINNSQGQIVQKQQIDEALSFIGSNISIPKRIEEMREVVDFAIKHCTINPVKNELLAYAEKLNLSLSDPQQKESIDLNKILELKPNFFGIGLNVNEIIERIKRRFKKSMKKENIT